MEEKIYEAVKEPLENENITLVIIIIYCSIFIIAYLNKICITILFSLFHCL